MKNLYSFFKKKRLCGMTLSELLIALSISTLLSAAVMVLYILLLRGNSDTAAMIQTQRKVDSLMDKLARGPMGTFGGIRTAYYLSSGSSTAPNPWVGGTTIQTLSFYVQTNFFTNNFSSFDYIRLQNYSTSTNLGARYTVGYDTTNRMFYYTIGTSSEINMMGGFPPNITVTRLTFVPSNACVYVQLDVAIQKANFTTITNSYNSVIAYRNTPLE